MGKKQIKVSIKSVGIEDYDCEYVQPAGEQLYERFVLVKDDKALRSLDVYLIKGGARVPYKAFTTEEKEVDNYVDVCFYPTEDTVIELQYELSPDRLAFRLDLSAIRHLLAATEITRLPSPVSYFYSDWDDIHDWSHNFDEDSTYYYDDGEGVSFVVRLTASVDLRLTVAGKEYRPVETEETYFGKQKVYEYRFGTLDDFDPRRSLYPRIVMHAPASVATFYIGDPS